MPGERPFEDVTEGALQLQVFVSKQEDAERRGCDTIEENRVGALVPQPVFYELGFAVVIGQAPRELPSQVLLLAGGEDLDLSAHSVTRLATCIAVTVSLGMMVRLICSRSCRL